MKWIKASIEEMELPVTEVLAVNDRAEFLVGYLTIRGSAVECEDEYTILPNVTHFIETKNIQLP